MDELTSQAVRFLLYLVLALGLVTISAAAIFFFRKTFHQWSHVARLRDEQICHMEARLDALAEEVRGIATARTRRNGGELRPEIERRPPIANDAGQFGQFMNELQLLVNRYVTVALDSIPSDSPAAVAGGGGLTAETVRRDVRISTEPLTLSSLLAWWRAEGHMVLEACKDSLQQRFGEVEVHLVCSTECAVSDSDWLLLAIRMPDDRFVLLPRRMAGWTMQAFSPFFELKEWGNVKEGTRVGRVLGAPVVVRSTDGWRVEGEKGTLSVQE
ncbi:hypothetical protein [Pelagibius sp. Alg239-R121]|uniref:hypothetical protein n=1 Tax=Pelagibius sp. Alg239-R121 TaxID=2993448 RepID=UPI0024A71566|nr:hypothetical protein [Pelagibius sp. Alg239-R121]